MANTFKRKTSRSIGTSLTAVGAYAVPASTTAIGMSLIVTNRTAAAVKVAVTHNDGTNDTYIVGGPTTSTMGATIAAGDSLVVFGADSKVVMEATDSFKVISDTAASVDAILSVMEMT
jgi:hypothetical protein